MIDTVPNETNQALVLTKAALRAGKLLGLTNAKMAIVLGVSRATVARLIAGQAQIDPKDRVGEVALMLVRLFRSLDAVLGRSVPHHEWMEGYTTPLTGRPIDLIESVQGLTHTLDYLDGMRTPI